MIAARQTKPTEGRMYRKQTFKSYSRNLHEFVLNIISVPSYRQEGCPNVTQKTTIFSSSRCWQEKEVWVFVVGLGFVFFLLSLFQLSRSPLCPNRKLHGEVAALHTETSLQMVSKALHRVPSTHHLGWSETSCYMACTSAPLLHFVKNRKFWICGRVWHSPLLELSHRKYSTNAV